MEKNMSSQPGRLTTWHAMRLNALIAAILMCIGFSCVWIHLSSVCFLFSACPVLPRAFSDVIIWKTKHTFFGLCELLYHFLAVIILKKNKNKIFQFLPCFKVQDNWSCLTPGRWGHSRRDLLVSFHVTKYKRPTVCLLDKKFLKFQHILPCLVVVGRLFYNCISGYPRIHQ